MTYAVKLLAALLPLAFTLPLLAQAPTARRPEVEKPVTEHPGFVTFDDVERLFGDDALEIHISVKDAMLRLVAAATRQSEPDLAQMIGGLRAIEVMVYNIDDQGGRSRVRQAITDTAGRLRRAGWEPAIDIRLEDSGGFLYFRFQQSDNPVGLAGIFLDGKEAVFINIVGTIDPALLGRLAARFNISLLDELDAALPKTPAKRPR